MLHTTDDDHTDGWVVLYAALSVSLFVFAVIRHFNIV